MELHFNDVLLQKSVSNLLRWLSGFGVGTMMKGGQKGKNADVISVQTLIPRFHLLKAVLRHKLGISLPDSQFQLLSTGSQGGERESEKESA